MKNNGLSANGMIKRGARSGLALVLVATLTLEATSLIMYYFSVKGIEEEASIRAYSELDKAKLELESITGKVEIAAKNSVTEVSENLFSPDKLLPIAHKVLDRNPLIHVVGIPFIADYYQSKGHWYEPLSAMREDGIEDMILGSEGHDYLSKEWFINGVAAGKGRWSEPYYDESGAKNLVVTYTEPVRDADGRVVALLCSDIPLDWLQEMVANLKVYPSSFSTVVSREGQMIACPAETLDVAKAVRYQTTMDVTGWTMTIVVPEDEIFSGVRRVGTMVLFLQILGIIAIILIIRTFAKRMIEYKELSDKEKHMAQELQIASNIQMSMIPKIFPPFPERKDIDMSAAIVPAKEVGGDLYDFFIRDEKLFFCIGDVSGKGIPASLVMAITHSLFRSASTHLETPADIVSEINKSISSSNEANMFVTLFCGVLDLGSGLLQYCNAGHNAPFIFTDHIDSLPVEANLPVGIWDEMNFVEQEIQLHADDALFLYTDGLTEAENSKQEQFGEERSLSVLHVRRSAAEHLEAIKQAVSDFVGAAPQSDDLTLLFIHYLGS